MRYVVSHGAAETWLVGASANFSPQISVFFVVVAFVVFS
jgi:hypothetical protein